MNLLFLLKAIALVDIVIYFNGMGKKFNLNLWHLHSVLQIEGSGGFKDPYLGYVEAHLRLPEVSAFDTDVLLLIVPDSVHTAYAPITLGTLHIDMTINLTTKTELENINK